MTIKLWNVLLPVITLSTEFINLITPKLLFNSLNLFKKLIELYSLTINQSNVKDIKRITLDIVWDLIQ